MDKRTPIVTMEARILVSDSTFNRNAKFDIGGFQFDVLVNETRMTVPFDFTSSAVEVRRINPDMLEIEYSGGCGAFPNGIILDEGVSDYDLLGIDLKDVTAFVLGSAFGIEEFYLTPQDEDDDKMPCYAIAEITFSDGYTDYRVSSKAIMDYNEKGHGYQQVKKEVFQHIYSGQEILAYVTYVESHRKDEPFNPCRFFISDEYALDIRKEISNGDFVTDLINISEVSAEGYEAGVVGQAISKDIEEFREDLCAIFLQLKVFEENV